MKKLYLILGSVVGLCVAGAVLAQSAQPLQWGYSFTSGVSTAKYPGLTIDGGYTVATLPGCAAVTRGAAAYVSDASAAPVYNATAVGGGAVGAPVACDGTNWTYH